MEALSLWPGGVRGAEAKRTELKHLGFPSGRVSGGGARTGRAAQGRELATGKEDQVHFGELQIV